MRSAQFAQIAHIIGEVPNLHRKQWEFCYIYRVLETAGMLQPGKRGLVFGAGREPLVAAFAARGVHVLATDMAPDLAEESGWADTSQHAWGKEALNDRGLCPPEVFDANVEFRVVDMNHIPEDLGTFDFVWSACAFEHLRYLRCGHDFIMNAANLLAPDRIGVHTTKMNCSSNFKTLAKGSTVLFRQQDFRKMAQKLGERGFNVCLNFDLGDEPLDHHVDVAPYKDDEHLKLQIAEWVTTSFGLVAGRPA